MEEARLKRQKDYEIKFAKTQQEKKQREEYDRKVEEARLKRQAEYKALDAKFDNGLTNLKNAVVNYSTTLYNAAYEYLANIPTSTYIEIAGISSALALAGGIYYYTGGISRSIINTIGTVTSASASAVSAYANYQTSGAIGSIANTIAKTNLTSKNPECCPTSPGFSTGGMFGIGLAAALLAGLLFC